MLILVIGKFQRFLRFELDQLFKAHLVQLMLMSMMVMSFVMLVMYAILRMVLIFAFAFLDILFVLLLSFGCLIFLGMAVLTISFGLAETSHIPVDKTTIALNLGYENGSFGTETKHSK